MKVALYRKDMTFLQYVKLIDIIPDCVEINKAYFYASDFYIKTDEGFIRVYIEK